MATKSRLGKGLGALFPALPGDPNESKQQATEPNHTAAVEADASTLVKQDKASSGTSQRENKHAQNRTPARDTASVEARPQHQRKHDDVSRETSATSETSTHAASANTKQHAHGQSRLQHRMSIPSLEEMTHPSDVFFGAMQSTEAVVEKRAADENKVQQNRATDATFVANEEASRARSDEAIADADNRNGSTDDNVSRETAADTDGRNEELKPVQGGYLAELKLDDIGPNKEQPRTIFDEDELRELAESIREVGVLQPIVVRKRPQSQIVASAEHQADTDDTNDVMRRPYELIMGERRWRASQLAGLETIPAIVKTTSDNEMLRDALLENLHRVALNPLEEAAAYQQMIDEFGLTQAQLSKSVSKSRPQIANTLRLLNLPASVQKKVAAGVLSAGHARALLGLSNEEDMDKLANRIIAEGLSVRSTEEIVALKTMAGEKPKKENKKVANPWADSPIRQHLEQRLDTKVTIKGNQKKGRIEITFSSPDDMQRILGILMPQQQEGNASAAADGESDWV
ncbi:ParB/RepB/Spo0J family partition protein [Bifidobacterium thermophilum]|uniref:ParB/RepB/Spo0J family partition protein n=1 Tax=Bifidobacterium thermophilum TaxID=33905 RepID=A0A7X9NR14_9BIFI|nr:ParB/RepB/Spo0J family partition protein [Bifidobacterium thermophilum]NME62246.1 ParB/RepB/Spo0J family partition protein [Bifidobacterium thermophilum]